MNTLRTDPWQLVNGLARDFDRIVLGTPVTRRAFVPVTDIHEHDDRYEIVADIPGVDPADLNITVDDGVLTLSGSREADDAVPEENRTAARERATGAFSRQFRLPDTVSSEDLAADYRHGVLTITLPKRSRPEPRRVEVKTH